MSGEWVIASGDLISNICSTWSLNALVAVAVKAIMPLSDGIKLLISVSCVKVSLPTFMERIIYHNKESVNSTRQKKLTLCADEMLTKAIVLYSDPLSLCIKFHCLNKKNT